MKSIEELRNQARRIINIVREEKLTVEEGIYVIECAKFLMTLEFYKSQLKGSSRRE